MRKPKKAPEAPQEPQMIKGPQMLSIRKFAEAIGRTPDTIYTHIKNGALSYTLINGVKKIDLEKGREEMAAHIGPLENKSVAAGITPQDLGKTEFDVLSDATQAHVPVGAMSYAQAKAYREAFTARQKELEFKIKSGLVIDKEKVEKAAFEVARIARETILGIPDKIAADLAAEPDVQKVHFTLRAALVEALETIANENLFKETRTVEIEGPSSNEPEEAEENEN